MPGRHPLSPHYSPVRIFRHGLITIGLRQRRIKGKAARRRFPQPVAVMGASPNRPYREGLENYETPSHSVYHYRDGMCLLGFARYGPGNAGSGSLPALPRRNRGRHTEQPSSSRHPVRSILDARATSGRGSLASYSDHTTRETPCGITVATEPGPSGARPNARQELGSCNH